MKKINKIFCLCLMCIALLSCATKNDTTKQNKTLRVGDEVEIQIISTSDAHGKFLPYDYALNAPDYSGSLSQISSAINEFMNENTVLVDVGDTIQGNSAELFLNDKIHPMIRAQNLMKYDAWVLGNHEFNYGMDVLKKIIEQHESKVLCGNVYYPDGKCIADTYTIINKQGVKVAIIGMVTPNIVKWDKANLDKANIKVTNPASEIRKVIDKIKNDVDLIVVACHMDCENEYGLEDSGVYDIADKIPEIDIILAAHGHKKIEALYRNNILITENNDLGKTINRITVKMKLMEDGKFSIMNRDSRSYDMKNYKEDDKISKDKIIVDADKRAKDDAQTIIAKLSNISLSPEDEIKGITQAKIQQTALLNLINDVQMYYTGAEISGAALFVDNANMFKGDIRKCDMALVYKYANTLYKLRMTGRQIKKWMEWSYRYFNTFKNGDLTFSFNPDIRGYNYDMFKGVSYEVDISKEPGKRIINLKLDNGKDLNMNEWYIVAVNNYRANSQLLSYGEIFTQEDGLPQLLEIDVRGDIGGVRELIGDYIVNVAGVKDANGEITLTVPNVNYTNRTWKLTGYKWDSEKHKRVAQLINEGKIKLNNSQDGRYTNVSSITENDLAEYENSIK